ncbi:hypothetical protein AB0L35_03235 [Streptomyces sp. NPDC052309]|uniref:hypothetical protein n=1 Tax=Streptomyces sp. NPDC052309 TaxID=3155421 RepID=UPI00343F0FBA
MPADEVTRGPDVETSRVRTGPRHAAPKKPLFTRFHMPAGKAIALAAMPTAVLMGMGFTPTLAIADGNDGTTPSSKSLTADEYKDCVAALEDAENGSSESGSPDPSPSATQGQTGDEGDADEPDPSASSEGTDNGTDPGTGSSSSPDSGSDDETEPAPDPSASAGKEAQSGTDGASGGSTATASPSPSESGGGLLEEIGDAVEGILTGGKSAEESPSPTPTPSASASESPSADPAGKAAGTVDDTVKDATDAASEAAGDTGETVERAAEATKEATEEATEAAGEVTDAPGPDASESAGVDPEDCPVATDAEGGVDNAVPLPDDPWYLDASSLLLKGASYKGIVEVKTASGTTKKVLKYVISDGTDIGDLHQTVKDPQSGKTYHVQAAEGSTSTIRDGDTVMYTESISGNLLGLIPITFDPEHPPPLDIPLIYFTKVKVVQAGQFGGTLHVPGLHQYITD